MITIDKTINITERLLNDKKPSRFEPVHRPSSPAKCGFRKTSGMFCVVCLAGQNSQMTRADNTIIFT